MRKILLVLSMLTLASPALAGLNNPALLAWNDEQRVAFGTGIGYGWFSSAGETPTPTFGKEFMANASATWALGRLSSLGLVGWYGFDNRYATLRPQWTVALGPLGQGTPLQVYAQLGYAMWYATGDQLAPAIPREFEAGVTVTYPIGEYVSAGGSSRIGLESKLVSSFVGLVAHRSLGGD